MYIYEGESQERYTLYHSLSAFCTLCARRYYLTITTTTDDVGIVLILQIRKLRLIKDVHQHCMASEWKTWIQSQVSLNSKLRSLTSAFCPSKSLHWYNFHMLLLHLIHCVICFSCIKKIYFDKKCFLYLVTSLAVITTPRL